MTTALTPRESYIALELCDGHSYKDLAEKLDLSASRIAKQVQTIFSKLGINRKGSSSSRVPGGSASRS